MSSSSRVMIASSSIKRFVFDNFFLMITSFKSGKFPFLLFSKETLILLHQFNSLRLSLVISKTNWKFWNFTRTRYLFKISQKPDIAKDTQFLDIIIWYSRAGLGYLRLTAMFFLEKPPIYILYIRTYLDKI